MASTISKQAREGVPSTMRALRIESFVSSYQELTVGSSPTPQPQSDEYLVKITHTGLNYVDLLYARGKHQNNTALVRPPFILGLEFAGIIVSCPSSRPSAQSNEHFKVGDRVFGGGLGSFAEYICAKSSQLQLVPDEWSNADAAGMAATLPVAYGALARIAGVKKGESVLVHAAAGGLGVMAVQVGKALGADVIAAVGSAAKAKVVHEILGVPAEKVVRYDQEGWENRVLDLTGGARGGVDVVFDTVGLVERSIRCTKYAGRVIIAGFAGREGNLEKVAANRILLKSVKVLGYRFGEHGRRFPDETPAVWQGVNDLVKRNLIHPVIYEKDFIGLESIPQAMQEMADRKVWGKLIIELSPPRQPKARF